MCRELEVGLGEMLWHGKTSFHTDLWKKRLSFYTLAACSQNINIAVAYAEGLVDMAVQGCWVTTCKAP